MCVVTEELSRGYIGVGSLGTRSEIAAELIRARRHRGAEAELAAAHRLGRDPADRRLHRAQHRLRSRQPAHARRARRRHLSGSPGNKTWITHAARSRRHDLAGAHRSPRSPATRACRCSWRRSRAAPMPSPFPAKGMSGGEIRVLGYRGMKEYELAFDGFEVPAANLLGGARARASSSSWRPSRARASRPPRAPSAWRRTRSSSACAYARDRIQFGKPIYAFPRVARQARLDGGRNHDRPPAHLFRRPREGQRPALRYRGRHGQAAGRARRLGQRRQRAADPWRQRLCRWNTRSAACCATRASSTSSRAPPRSRPRSSAAG